MSTITTTLSIDQPLLLRVQRAYGFKTKKETVNAALEKMARRKALDDLIAMMGTVDMDSEEEIKAREKAEIAKMDKFYASLDW